MNIAEAIASIDRQVKDPSKGLPEEVFLFVSSLTPLVNVDLLIKDEIGRTLLAWRNDQYAGKGWHLPGGIVRLKETMTQRLEKVAEAEIGSSVSYSVKPIAVNELILKAKIRGHFISFLFACNLPCGFIPQNKGLQPTDAGYLMWHVSCPADLLKCHEIYRQYIVRGT